MKQLFTYSNQRGAVKSEYTVLSTWFLLFIFIGMVNLGVESEITLCEAAAASSGLTGAQAGQYVESCIASRLPACSKLVQNADPNRLTCQRNPSEDEIEDLSPDAGRPVFPDQDEGETDEQWTSDFDPLVDPFFS